MSDGPDDLRSNDELPSREPELREDVLSIVERGKVVKDEGRYWPAEHLGEEE